MTAPPIEVTTIVSVSPELAFKGFVGRFGAWWPLEGFTISSRKLKQPPQKLFIESGLGGRIIEVDAEGVEHIWGSVKTWTLEPTNTGICSHSQKCQPLRQGLCAV